MNLDDGQTVASVALILATDDEELTTVRPLAGRIAPI